jgi:peroxiredoxin
MSPPAVATVPPPFTLPDHTGAPVSLADLVGRHVLVWFYSRAFGSN